MANAVKRMIKEQGVVLEKIFKEASSEFKGSDGNIVQAQPDRYILKCVSGEDFSKTDGFIGSTVLQYKVDKATFDKAVVYASVEVKYEVSNYGAKPISLELQEKK